MGEAGPSRDQPDGVRLVSCGRKAVKRALLVAASIAAVAVASPVPSASRSTEPVRVPGGLLTGQHYLDLGDDEKGYYALGLVDGMLVAPLLRAPASEVRWLRQCLTGMTGRQLADILTRYLRDHPEKRQDPAHVPMLTAMRAACGASG